MEKNVEKRLEKKYGEKNSKLEIAKKMKDKGIKIEIIQEITKLTQEEINLL